MDGRLSYSSSPSSRAAADGQTHLGLGARLGAVVANSARLIAPDLSLSAPVNLVVVRTAHSSKLSLPSRSVSSFV